MKEFKYAKSYKDLKKSTLLRKSLNEEDLVYVEDEQRAYVYTKGTFEPYTITSESNLNFSLYDMNKQIISQLPNITKEEAIKKLDEYILKNNKVNYFMFLNNEAHYYTILHYNKEEHSINPFAETVLDCIKSIGELKAIDVYDDRVEIWIIKKNDIFDYLIFPYDMGVVDFG